MKVIREDRIEEMFEELEVGKICEYEKNLYLKIQEEGDYNVLQMDFMALGKLESDVFVKPLEGILTVK